MEFSEKKERTIELLRKVYGYQYIPRYDGSPYEEHQLDDAELVLHELAHQTLMPEDLVFSPGYMKDANELVGWYIDSLPDWKQDLHEIKALAVQFVVSKRLSLGMDQHIIARNAAMNSSYYKQESDFGRFVLAIRRAKKTIGVQCRADTIIELLELIKENSICLAPSR